MKNGQAGGSATWGWACDLEAEGRTRPDAQAEHCHGRGDTTWRNATNWSLQLWVFIFCEAKCTTKDNRTLKRCSWESRERRNKFGGPGADNPRGREPAAGVPLEMEGPHRPCSQRMGKKRLCWKFHSGRGWVERTHVLEPDRPDFESCSETLQLYNVVKSSPSFGLFMSRLGVIEDLLQGCYIDWVNVEAPQPSAWHRGRDAGGTPVSVARA